MRIAYLDCFSGISGDMFLGALLDAGVPLEVFTRTVAALKVDAQVEVSRVQRSGISATKLDVIVAGEKELPREEFWARQTHPQEHDHEHSHEHHHSHEHEHGHGGKHTHRGLKEIREIIGRANTSQRARAQAIRIFEVLGTAEAKIHNTDVEQIHFHEVGAVDAIVDITCAAVGAEALAVDSFVCSPLNVGGGMVKCAHGTFPIPAPATLEILRNAPIYSGEIQKELVTPTGAAIVSVLASRFGNFPRMKPEKIGYGAGSRDLGDFPNVLRITIGETLDQHSSLFPEEAITMLEANVDDMSPQLFGYVMDRAFQEGALDVFAASVQMKKSRPGLLLSVLCHPEDAERLKQLMFAETTTLGVRIREERRAVLARHHLTISTRWGDVRMKVANLYPSTPTAAAPGTPNLYPSTPTAGVPGTPELNGSVSNYAPEYEDCRRIAEQQHVPLKAVMQEAIKVYLERKDR
jgi:pyridinium-3,5-bisthiocarboxylic acid mononucleotide nickel chelatase